MTRRDAIGLLCSGSVFMLSGCNEMFRKRFRFRMTVEVETPQGLRTGSGVMEVSAAKTTKILPEQHAVSTVFKGEAVPVDLPDGQTLFALVGDIGAGYSLASAAVKSFDPLTGPEDKYVASIGKLGETGSLGRSVPIRDMPKLVRFRNIRDPKTVELVDPKDLAKSFGPGVKLRQIVLTVVDEPVTQGIEKRLPKPFENGFFNFDGQGNWQDDPNFDQTKLINVNDFKAWGTDK
jgi:hypothetical protein